MPNFRLIFLPLFYLLVSCGNLKHADSVNEANHEVDESIITDSVEISQAILTKEWELYRKSVPMNINNVSISGNKMSVKVSYNGGCKEHYFKMVGYQFTTKSLPAQRVIKIYHDPNQDDCRELVSDTLEFEISALGLDNNQAVNLQLEGYPEDIIYTRQ